MIYFLFYFLLKKEYPLEQSFNISLFFGSILYLLLVNISNIHYYSSIVIPIDILFFFKKYLHYKEQQVIKSNIKTVTINPVLKPVHSPTIRINKIYPKEDMEKNNYIPATLDIHHTIKHTLENITS